MRAIYHEGRPYIDAVHFITDGLKHARDLAEREAEDTNPALIQLINTVWQMVRLGRFMIEGKYASVEQVEEWFRYHFPTSAERFFERNLCLTLVCDEESIDESIDNAIDLHPIAQADMRRVLA